MEMDQNLVEIWLRRDPIRWISGAIAGLFASTVAILVAGGIASRYGFEFWFPLKLLGTILIGPSATEFGLDRGGMVAGGVLFEVLGLFLGVVYAHFTGTNRLLVLIPMGLVWGIFSWIFIWNLFMQSFPTIRAASIPPGPVFPICISFGLCLIFVPFFESLFRPRRKA